MCVCCEASAARHHPVNPDDRPPIGGHVHCTVGRTFYLDAYCRSGVAAAIIAGLLRGYFHRAP